MNPNNAMYSESKWGAAFESPLKKCLYTNKNEDSVSGT